MLKKGLLALTAAVLFPLSALAADQGNLVVHVTGLRNDKGVVRVALFNSADTYTNSHGAEGNAKGAFMKGSAPVKSAESSYTFENVPYGDYAIKLFHDEDNSGKFVTGMFGIPKVEYGFSNNAKGKMGPAPYADAKFAVSQPSMTMDIKVHHGM